jgi:RNA polymerase sigma factor (sigma-70 family)
MNDKKRGGAMDTLKPLNEVEQQQLEELYTKHRRMIVAIYHRYGGPNTGIELDDWVQQAFLVLMLVNSHFDPNYRTDRGDSVKLTTYFYRCLANAIIRMRRMACRAVNVSIDEHQRMISTDGIDPEACIDFIDINAAVSRMCNRTREVWRMYMSGYSPSEIAQAMGLKVSTVRKRLQRARSQARKLCA